MMNREVYPPRKLDDKGRCCGRKPLFYKTHRGAGVVKDPHHFCAAHCNAEFDTDGNQKANWAWLKVRDGFTPAFPGHAYVNYARAAIQGRLVSVKSDDQYDLFDRLPS